MHIEGSILKLIKHCNLPFEGATTGKEWLEELDARCETLTDVIGVCMMEAADKESQRSKLYIWQGVLGKAMDVLYERYNECTQKERLVYSNALMRVEASLRFVEDYFTELFNAGMMMPRYIYERDSIVLRERYMAIRNQIKGNTYGRLNELFFEEVEMVFEEGKHEGFEYCRLYYLRRVAGELDVFLAEEKAPEDIKWFVIGINFNRPAVIEFLIRDYEERMQAENQKSDYLRKEIGILQKIIIKECEGVMRNRCSVLDKMMLWLNNELDSYTETLLHHNNTNKNEPAFTGVSTELSVAQLAFFTRLLIEGNVISCSNQTALLNTIALAVSNKQRGRISADSLRNKYYSPEVSTANAVKDKLIQMMNAARRLT